ncbi:MAG: DNA/RNA non-specific endonuclease [Myxococcales bacterium]|nr:DNA/RNA non-specific endonuclease [Myxococcales bacterium]
MQSALRAILNDRALARDIIGRVPRLDDRLSATATRGIVDLESSLSISPDLEKIVLLHGRPALLVQGGTFVPPQAQVLAQRLAAARQGLDAAIASTGRVELETEPGGIGSAWMIAEGVAVTNAHVARAFAYFDGSKVRFRKLLGGLPRVAIDFAEEYDVAARNEHEVEEVLYIAADSGDESQPDVALLRLAKKYGSPPPPPLPLAKDGEGDLAGREVAVIGYPEYDPSEDPDALSSVFKSIYGVKRLSPGQVIASPGGTWYFAHDASTLGGSSGSVVVDLAKGAALGLHFSGYSRRANYAVRAPAILKVLQHLDLVPAPPPVVFLPAAPQIGEPERASAGELDARDGYQEDFLGIPVPAPQVVDAASVAARSDGKGGEPLRYRHFSIQVHSEYKQPIWSAVNIDGTRLRRPTRPSTRAWAKDPRLADDLQIGHEFYSGSGFSRGHIVRRLDPAWGEGADEGNRDTFHFTNACPQDQEFNDKFWGDLEDEVLRDAEGQRITVLTGPAFEGSYFYEMNGVEAVVPNRFWKVVAIRRDGELAASAFLLDQAPYLEAPRAGASWSVYQVRIADLEVELGLDFGDALRAADVSNVLEGALRRRLLGDVSEAIFFR